MTASGEDLPERVIAELRSLRKGRGLQVGDLDSRLGPLMRELAGPGDAAARRQALITEINRCSAQLLGDYRTAIEASLALSAETMQEPYFRERVSWLAGQLHRDYRTALRRIDEAERRLAEVIAVELNRQRRPAGGHVQGVRRACLGARRLRRSTLEPDHILAQDLTFTKLGDGRRHAQVGGD